jgi:hypothetical protein
MVETLTMTKDVWSHHSRIWISRTVDGLKQNITNGLVVLAAKNIEEYRLKKEDLKPLILPVCISMIENSSNIKESDMQFVMQVFDLKSKDVRSIYIEYVIGTLREGNINLAVSKLEKLNSVMAYNMLLRKAD